MSLVQMVRPCILYPLPDLSAGAASLDRTHVFIFLHDPVQPESQDRIHINSPSKFQLAGKQSNIWSGHATQQCTYIGSVQVQSDAASRLTRALHLDPSTNLNNLCFCLLIYIIPRALKNHTCMNKLNQASVQIHLLRKYSGCRPSVLLATFSCSLNQYSPLSVLVFAPIFSQIKFFLGLFANQVGQLALRFVVSQSTNTWIAYEQ